MKYKTFKCNLLFYISKLIWGRDFKKLCNEYLKIRDSVPEQRKKAGRTLWNNYRFRKKHRSQYKVISLGWNCLPRTLLTLWMLKPSKGAGEKSMPFDLIATPPTLAAHFLHNDFADYFDDEWVYKTENGYKCWHGEVFKGVFFPHDPDCGPGEEGREKLRARLRKRIEAFREAMVFEGPVLFVFHKALLWDLRPIDHKTEDIELLCSEVARLRKGKPYKILVFACDHEDECQQIAGAEFVRLKYPRADYIWHVDRLTPEGIEFETDLVSTCRCAIEKLLKENCSVPRI